MKTYRSVCPFDCPDTCALLIDVDNNKAIATHGDPNHPITRGLLCPKMQNYERTVHSPNRLTTPLKRSGAKGEGKFETISWDEAIETVCGRFKEIIKSNGAESILPYSYAGTMGLVNRNSGHPFFHKLGASRLERTICSPAKDHGWVEIMGGTQAPDPEIMKDSDFIILWGINAAATSIHTMRDSQTARKQGAQVIAIDTYRTQTCCAVDDSYIVKPGGDGALALAMMHILHNEGLTNDRFISENLLGYEEFATTVLNHCSPEKMSVFCGISPDQIRKLAHYYAAAKAPYIRLGSGLTRYANGAMTVRTITCLPAVVGAWDTAGGGIFTGTSTGGAFPLHVLTREDFLPKKTRFINMNQLGDALSEKIEQPIKALYVYHSNPASVAPDQNSVIKGLLREDLFTVVHERFMTDTARYADIVLPATSSLEHPDLYRSYGSYYSQRTAAVIPPIGEARSNWDTFSALAKGMDWDEPFFNQTTDELIEKLLEEENCWRDKVATEKLRNGEPTLLTPPTTDSKRWLTDSGKIEILNKNLGKRLPHFIRPYAESDPYPLRLQPAVTPFALNSSFYEQPELQAKQKVMNLMMNHQDAAVRNLSENDQVIAYNNLGEVLFNLEITDRTPSGTVVTEGVWWSSLNGNKRGVNALTSQRLTDGGRGSTLYDVAVDVRKA